MIVSWNWLRDYVKLDCAVESAAERLMMSGLNLEEIQPADEDFAIDLEVTSNRPDCLGHVGVARELSVLYGVPLSIPKAGISCIDARTADVTSVENLAAEDCTQYQARVIRGVKVGPSPEWLVHRLETLGLRSVNNVVDVTNYVLMECGQPLHAFDLNKLAGQRIVVRRASQGEPFVAINGRKYELDSDMCVIADAERAVAIAGVMGGQESEVSEATTDLLIETANFVPLSVRRTARRLSLFSDSSFRFERGVDVTQIDWASRRCCELIVELCGGEVLAEPICVGDLSGKRAEMEFRFGQVERILGISIPAKTCREILIALGCEELSCSDELGKYRAPSWRADLTREADLIEEVARIYGYDRIPENDPPAVEAIARSRQDRTLDLVNRVLNGAGFYEAMTMTFVSEEMNAMFNPRGVSVPLSVEHSSRKKENVLRSSLVPSLLACRRANERTGTENAQLFEVARVFTALTIEGAEQPLCLSCVSGRSFLELKGVLEALVKEVDSTAKLTARIADVKGLAEGRSAELLLNGKRWGWMGEVSEEVLQLTGLRDTACAAEVELQTLIDLLNIAPQTKPIPQFPAVERDFNFLLAETTSWEELAVTIEKSGGPLLEEVSFVSEYRGENLGAGKKTYLARVAFRSDERTLTGEDADAAHAAIVSACESGLQAELR